MLPREKGDTMSASDDSRPPAWDVEGGNFRRIEVFGLGRVAGTGKAERNKPLFAIFWSNQNMSRQMDHGGPLLKHMQEVAKPRLGTLE